MADFGIKTKTYLGDGVYAQVDVARQIRLSVENGIEELDVIYLEPEVIRALLSFIQSYGELIGVKSS